MKKTLVSLMIIFVLITALAACNLDFDSDLFSSFTENNEILGDLLTDFKTHADALADTKNVPENVQTAFDGDFLVTGIYELSELAYYGIITVYNTGLFDASSYSDMQNLNVTESGDTYTLTFTEDGKNTVVTVKTDENSSSITHTVQGEVTFMIEKIKLADDEFAIQVCSVDTSKIVYSFYVKGVTGRLSVDEDADAVPASIYKDSSKITSTFATGGDRNYVVTADDFTYSGEFYGTIDTYLVTFEENGGTSVTDITVSVISSSPVTTKTGFTFAGWFTDSACTSAITFPYTVTQATTLYAKWVDNSAATFAVTYEENGGTSVTDVTVSVISSSPVSTKTGYTFVGWFTNSACTGSAITFPYTVTQATTLYAKWVDNSAATFTVTYEENGGTAVTDVTVSVISSSPVTTKTGYTLVGWYSDSACTGSAITFPYTVTQATTLYAKWQENTSDGYLVTFEENGGTAVSDITTAEISSLPVTTKDNAQFTGWFLTSDCDGTAVTFPFTVSYAVTLYAGWETAYPEIITVSEEFNEALFDKLTSIAGNSAFISGMTDPEKADYYSLITDNFSGQWAAPTILWESILALQLYYDGTFNDVYTAQGGKTPSVNYTEATNTYQVNLWLSKGLYTYWFENILSFDEATDSLNATIKCGIDAQQITRNKFQYNRMADGTFVAWTEYLEDDTVPDGEKSVMKLSFNNSKIEVAYNRFIVAGPYTPYNIYEETLDSSSLYTEFDKYMSLVGDTLTYENNLYWSAYEFVTEFALFNDGFFTSIENSGYEDFFPQSDFSYREYENYYYEALVYINNVYTKVVNEEPADGVNITYNYLADISGTYHYYDYTDDSNPGFAVSVIIWFNNDDKMFLSWEESDGLTYSTAYKTEIMKLSEGYAMQVLSHYEYYYEDETPDEVTDNDIEVRIFDADNGRMAYDCNTGMMGESIFSEYSESTFATNGDYYEYTYVDGELTDLSPVI